MEGIVLSVFKVMASGVVGNATYDSLKVILGSSFDKLSSYLANKQEAKFEGALEMLLEDKTIAKKIEELMEGKIIDNSFKGLTDSKVDADLGKGAKVTDSFKDNRNSPIKIR